jgi:hypothetical protein
MSKLTPRHWVYLLLHLVVFMAGVLIVRVGGAIASGLGSSLVAAAVAGWVLFVWVLVNQDQARRIEILARLGLIDAFTARSTHIKEQYDQRLAGARQCIDIMGFGLRQLREDYNNEFAVWASRAQVRILLIDPEAPDPAFSNADQRDSEEGNAPGSIAADVQEFVQKTTAVRAANPTRFQVRLYTALPSVNIFRVDDELFWGPYLVRTQSRNTPTFLVKRGGGLFDRLAGHFDELWSDPSLSHEPQAALPTDTGI